MQEIELSNIPNQKFSISLEERFYTISLRSLENGGTLADIERGGEPLINGLLCVPNIPLIPHGYLTQGGNFVFICGDGAYPYYENFGKSCKLYWLTDEELAEL